MTLKVFILKAMICLVLAPLLAQEKNQNTFSLTEQEKIWLSEHPVIKLTFDPGYAPIEMNDKGTFSGSASDYIKLIELKLDIKFEVIISKDWSQSLNRIKNKEADILTSVRKTQDRLSFMNFTAPYVLLETVIITRQDALALSEVTMKDLRGKTVAAVRDYFWTGLIMKDYPDIKIIEVPNLTDGLIAVSFGKADAFFEAYAPATNYLREKGITNLKVSGQTPYSVDYSMGIRNDWPELTSILNKVLIKDLSRSL